MSKVSRLNEECVLSRIDAKFLNLSPVFISTMMCPASSSPTKTEVQCLSLGSFRISSEEYIFSQRVCLSYCFFAGTKYPTSTT